MEIETGRMVHYVHGDGTHAPAVITHVHNDRGVVDLDVTREDGEGTFSRKTVVFSQSPQEYSWHFIEGEQGATKQETLGL